MRTLHYLLLAALIGSWGLASPRLHAGEPPDLQQIEFFESRVRPLLVEHCHKCHGPNKQEGGLRLDSRESILLGGDTGPALSPGRPDESELIRAIRYDPDGYQMPPTGKLPDEAIEFLARWAEMGAPWPDGAAVDAPQVSRFNLQERAQRWSFQPLKPVTPPDVHNTSWCRNPVDRFVLAKLEQAGLTPAHQAVQRTWLRRVMFDVIGLPPTPEEMQAFLSDHSPTAHEAVIDRLLASPHFGERWGRHWLDLVRYAESRGHEFDFDVANAWQYRDYVIRALNDDVPYDQFVVEHVAGDLLAPPACFAEVDVIEHRSSEFSEPTILRRHPHRLDLLTGANESILGTGFWFLGEWVHSPVDIRGDEAERFANMLDVYSKTFLGLTVACARCHDHKFDPITQKDYYALQGYLQSSGYRQVRFETMEHNRRISEELEDLRYKAAPVIAKTFVELVTPVTGQINTLLLASYTVIRQRHRSSANDSAPIKVQDLDEAWLSSIRAAAESYRVDAGLLRHWVAHLLDAATDDSDPLHLWARLAQGEWETPAHFAKFIDHEVSQWKTPDVDAIADEALFDGRSFTDQFRSSGDAFRRPTSLYDFKLTDDPGAPIASFDDTFDRELDPAFQDLRAEVGSMSEPGALGEVHRAGLILSTPTFELNRDFVSARIRGGCNVYLAIDSHVLIKGPLHASLAQEHPAPEERPDGWRWITIDVTRYQGHRAHLEFIPRPGEPFAIEQVIWSDDVPRERDTPVWLEPLLYGGSAASGSIEDLARLIGEQLANVTAVEWLYFEGGIGGAVPSSREAEWARRHPQLFGLDTPHARSRFAEVSQPYIERQRRLLSQIQPRSATAPAMRDVSGEDEYVFIRGNWTKRGETVPRRFLEVFDGENMRNSPGYPGDRDIVLYDCESPDGVGLSAGPAAVEASGRLQLAEWMVDPEKTPILPRVIVNRIWQHYFGRGIVPTPDDFGYMGQEPTHPELLDWLARELVAHDWSLKHIHRLILTSAAYRMSSGGDGSSLMVDGETSPDPTTSSIHHRPSNIHPDPDNLFLHRMNIKRLEGEIIRDAQLAVSGRLDERLYGASTPVHLTPFMEGRGRPEESGPVDGDGRRSLYIAVRRNFAEPFLQAFDMPNPHTTTGRRTVSNVPTQALALMNAPLVIEQARQWAERLQRECGSSTDEQRIGWLYQMAFGRTPTAGEVAEGRRFLATQAVEYETTMADLRVWADYCHVLVNTKEFVFVR